MLIKTSWLSPSSSSSVPRPAYCSKETVERRRYSRAKTATVRAQTLATLLPQAGIDSSAAPRHSKSAHTLTLHLATARVRIANRRNAFSTIQLPDLQSTASIVALPAAFFDLGWWPSRLTNWSGRRPALGPVECSLPVPSSNSYTRRHPETGFFGILPGLAPPRFSFSLLLTRLGSSSSWVSLRTSATITETLCPGPLRTAESGVARADPTPFSAKGGRMSWQAACFNHCCA